MWLFKPCSWLLFVYPTDICRRAEKTEN
jgi:hypothetical protein